MGKRDTSFFVFVVLAFAWLIGMILLFGWALGWNTIKDCEYKGVLTDFGSDSLFELDGERWVNAPEFDKSYVGWENKVYNGEPAYKCKGWRNVDIHGAFEVWKIGN